MSPTVAAPRHWRRMIGPATVLALLATACGGGDSDAPSDDASEGGTAVIVIDADPETLNPGLTTTNSTLDVSAKIFESLVWIDPDGSPQPLLATDWQISEDNLTYTFDLREEVTWHDGEPFSADDVVWSLTEGLAQNARAQGVLGKISSVEAPSDTQVVITLSQPYAPFLQQMKVFDVPILPQHIFDGTDISSNPANQEPIGTGPFVFEERSAGSSITLTANPDYWDEGKPLLDEIIYQIVPDAATRSAGLETGEYDFVSSYYLPRADVETLQATEGVEVRTETSTPSVHFLQMNEQNELLADVEVRQALATAIDRERLVDQAMSGLGIPGVGSFGAGFPWLVNEDSSYEELYPYDPDRAQEMLEEAGVPEGTTLRLTYDSAKVQFQAGSQIIADNLAQVGIDVTIEPLETSVYREAVYAQRDFDLALQSFTSSGDPAIGYHRIFVTNEERAPNINSTGYSNPEVDELLELAASVADLEERGDYYRQAQAILNEDVPTLILYDELQADAASTRLQGLYAGLSADDRWSEVSITE